LALRSRGRRKAVRSLDQRDPYPVIEAVDMLMHCAGVDLEDACVLVGLDERASQAVHEVLSTSLR
jgi:hypothetical protein